MLLPMNRPATKNEIICKAVENLYDEIMGSDEIYDWYKSEIEIIILIIKEHGGDPKKQEEIMKDSWGSIEDAKEG